MTHVRFAVAAIATFCVGSGAPAAAEPPQSTTVTHPTVEEDLRWRARGAERLYRHRLARLRRLRDLAVQDDRMDQVAQLDELYEQLRVSHAQYVDEIRTRMGFGVRDGLERELAEGRDPREWVHEHRTKASELLAESRERRSELRDQVRELRQEVRERHDERRQDAREHGQDIRQEVREDPHAQRQELHEQRHDLRQGVRDYRQDLRSKRKGHRREVRAHRGEIRHAAREAAEQQWTEARARAGAESDSREAAHIAGRQAVQDRARKQRDQQLQRAAKRNGILSDRPLSEQARADLRVPSQREANAKAETEITRDNAEAELAKLRREIDRGF